MSPATSIQGAKLGRPRAFEKTTRGASGRQQIIMESASEPNCKVLAQPQFAFRKANFVTQGTHMMRFRAIDAIFAIQYAPPLL